MKDTFLDVDKNYNNKLNESGIALIKEDFSKDGFILRTGSFQGTIRSATFRQVNINSNSVLWEVLSRLQMIWVIHLDVYGSNQ